MSPIFFNWPCKKHCVPWTIITPWHIFHDILVSSMIRISMIRIKLYKQERSRHKKKYIYIRIIRIKLGLVLLFLHDRDLIYKKKNRFFFDLLKIKPFMLGLWIGHFFYSAYLLGPLCLAYAWPFCSYIIVFFLNDISTIHHD